LPQTPKADTLEFMNNTLLMILGLSFLGSVLGLVGGIALLLKEQWAKHASVQLIAFAAGVILATTFLDLLPEAVEQGGHYVYYYALFGMVAFFLVEDFLLHFHHDEEHEKKFSSIVPLVIVGDSIHNFIDGIVIAASFMADPKLGLLVAIATFLHELPQEIGDFAVLMSAGVSKINVILANLLSALATFVGAIMTYFFIETSHSFIGPLVGVAVGMFLYISSVDILPEITKSYGKDHRVSSAIAFIFGLLLMVCLTSIIPA